MVSPCMQILNLFAHGKGAVGLSSCHRKFLFQMFFHFVLYHYSSGHFEYYHFVVEPKCVSTRNTYCSGPGISGSKLIISKNILSAKINEIHLF